MQFKNFFFVLLVGFSSVVWAQKVNQISVTGNSYLTKNAIITSSGVKVGDDLSDAQVTGVVRRLIQNLKLENASVQLQKGKLKIIVKEAYRISKVKIVLGSGLNKDAAKKVLEQFDIKVKQPFDDLKIQKAIQALRIISEQQGQNDVDVDVKYQIQGKSISIEIELMSSSGYTLRSVNFSGNQHFSSKILERISTLSTTGLLSPIIGDDYYSSMRLQSAVMNIKQVYADNGYFEAVILPTVKRFDDTKQVSVSFEIKEGELTRIGKVDFGNLPKDLAEKAQNLGIKTGSPMVRSQILRAEKMFANKFKDEGLLNTEVDVQVKQQKQNVVDLSFSLKKGKPFKVRFIQFMGNSRTVDATLRRYLEIIEGESYSQTKLDRAIETFQHLAYLEDASYEIVPVAGEKGLVDIIISVKEAKSSSISARGSYDTAQGFIFSAQFADKNFLGTGKMLNIDLERSGNGAHRYNASWSSPISMLNPNWSETVNLGYSSTVSTVKRDQTKGQTNSEVTKGDLYINKNISFSIVESIPYNQYIRFLVGLKPTFRHVENAKPGSLAYKFEQEYGATVKELQMIGGMSTVYVDKDIGQWDGEFKVTYAPAISGAVSYYKTLVRVEGKVPVTKLYDQNVTLNPVFKFGKGAGLSTKDGYLPYYQMFQMGNDFVVRGFDPVSAGPYYKYTGEKGFPIVDYVGGDQMASMNLNLWLPSPTPDIAVPGLYFDIASIQSRFEGAGMRYAYGVAMKLDTPMGQINTAYSLGDKGVGENDVKDRFWISMSGAL